MTTWDTLRSHTLIGTARRPVHDLEAAGHLVGDDVLAAASLLGIQRAAGRQAPSAAPLPTAAPDDPTAEAPQPAVQLLQVLLAGTLGRRAELDVLLDHWFALCAATGHRIPNRLLVDILTVASTRTDLQAVVRPVLGSTGRWLGALNPDWQWATDPLTIAEAGPSADTSDGDPEVDSEEWARLPRGERLAVIETVRRRDPAAGRALVTSTWGTDKAADRSAHLAALDIGLGTDDEDLLESALDDRSVKVREAAWALLDQLPNSKRAQRMAQRLRPLVSVAGTLRKTLVVQLPDDPDPAAERDGLVDTTGTGGSRRVGWLRRITLAAPLSTWSDITGWSPDRIATASVDPPEVSQFLVAASAVQRNQEWAAAFLAVHPHSALVPLVPVEVATPLLEAHVQNRATIDALMPAIGHLPGVWSPSLSHAVVSRLRSAVQAKEATALGSMHAWVPILTGHLHPSAGPLIATWRNDPLDDHVDLALRTLVQHISTIESITQAFAEGVRP